MEVTELSSSRGTGQDLSCHPQGLRSSLFCLSSDHLPSRGTKKGSVRLGVRAHGLFITEGGCHHDIPRASVILTFLLSEDLGVYYTSVCSQKFGSSCLTCFY